MGLQEAQFAEQTKLASLAEQQQPIGLFNQFFHRFANAGVPKEAAKHLAMEFECLVGEIDKLKARVDELEESKLPVHMRNVERR